MEPITNNAPVTVAKWRIFAALGTLLAMTALTIVLLITAPGFMGDFIRWQAAHNNGQYYPKLTGGLIFIGLGVVPTHRGSERFFLLTTEAATAVDNVKDEIFKTPGAGKKPFEFNAQVAHVFDDMVSRSVPFYKEVLQMSAELAREFYQPDTMIYDLGCSTGAIVRLIEREFGEQTFSYVGIDSSSEMIDRASSAGTGLKARASKK